MKKKEIEKVISQAIENAEALLIENGSVRIGLTDKERKVMSQVIYDDLAERGLKILEVVLRGEECNQ